MQGTEHVGREATFAALGREWRLGRWTRGVWRDWLAWAKRVLPDPLEAVSRVLDQIVAKDAEIYRDLLAKDEAEAAQAKKEGRAPRLLTGMYQPTSDQLLKAGLDKSCSYLSITSPEVRGLLTSPAGSAKMFALLLAKHHPQEAGDELLIEDLLDELGDAEAWRLMNRCQGRGSDRGNASEGQGGPASPPAPEAA